MPNALTKPLPKQVSYWVLAILVLAIIAGFVISSSGSGSPSANIKVHVANVIPLDGNTIRVYLYFDNTGKGGGSASCIMNTTVHNQFGDQVNIRTNSTGTNTIAPGVAKTLYQDIGVDNGDAKFIKPSDIQLVGC